MRLFVSLSALSNWKIKMAAAHYLMLTWPKKNWKKFVAQQLTRGCRMSKWPMMGRDTSPQRVKQPRNGVSISPGVKSTTRMCLQRRTT